MNAHRQLPTKTEDGEIVYGPAPENLPSCSILSVQNAHIGRMTCIQQIKMTQYHFHALHIAIAKENIDLARILLNAGANHSSACSTEIDWDRTSRSTLPSERMMSMPLNKD